MPASVFDQFCLSFHPARMPPCPTKGGLSVRFATLDQNFFENVNTRNCHIYRMALCIAGGIVRGGKAPSSFPASSQGQRSRQRVPSPSDPASEKVVCERDVQAHQARQSPGATQKAGLLTSTTSLAAGDGGWPPRVALARSSGVRQSNVYAGLMGSVEAVPRTLPMSPMGH